MNESTGGFQPNPIRIPAFLRKSSLAGVIAALAWSAGALAEPPEVPEEQNVPLQLNMIRDHLDAIDDRLDLLESHLSDQMTTMEGNLSGQMTSMESNLSTQMSTMETGLLARIDSLETTLQNIVGNVQSGVDLSNQKLDTLQVDMDSAHEKLDDIWDSVSKVNIDVSMTFCLDENIGISVDASAFGKIGAGWNEAFVGEAVFDVDAAIGGAAAVTGNICIELPALRVDSYPPLYFSDYGDAFAAMINDAKALVGIPTSGASLRAGAPRSPNNDFLTLLNGFADAYREVVPTPQEAMQAVQNIMEAEPAALLRPDLLLDPVIPEFIDDFIGQLPDMAEAFVSNPCGYINTASPFGPIIDTGAPAFNFLCGTSASALVATLGVIEDIADFLNDIVWCATHVASCLADPPEL